ncbi:MAG: AtpZ/AtpI family protein [Deltaproteobacteria bacterium]|nr:AtpZ/AtpI family protein [Deltaproteobacteria bacterium]
MPAPAPDWVKTAGLYGAMGFQLVGAVAAGMWLGGYLDRRLGTAPWCGVGGIVLGMIGGLWNLLRLLTWKGRHDQ